MPGFQYVGNAIPTPHQSAGDKLVDVEIAVSPSETKKFGVLLAPGQGVLGAGTVIARVAATKQYVRYNNGLDANAGGTAAGVLYQGIDTGADAGAAPLLGNIVTSGILKASLLSGADSDAITDLNARTDAALDQFIF